MRNLPGIALRIRGKMGACQGGEAPTRVIVVVGRRMLLPGWKE